MLSMHPWWLIGCRWLGTMTRAHAAAYLADSTPRSHPTRLRMERRPMKMILSIVLLVAVAIAAVVGYNVFRPPAQASGPIEAAPVVESTGAAAPAGTAFQIDPNASSAQFVIDEILRGSPKTVVGTTNQVAGEIAANLNDLDAAQVGTIKINARTLST